jgi:predicted nucleic acid-binding protein
LECVNKTGKCEWSWLLPRGSGSVRGSLETAEIFPTWRKLVLHHRVSGIHVYDARIVAAMTVHQVSKILTFDLDDFKRYASITVVHPTSI